MTYYPVTRETLEKALAARINEAEAELEALKAVKINTAHKTLTNRAIENGRIGDYSSLGKALYISFTVDRRHMSRDITAYTYKNPDGSEIGTEGFMRISRTMTPAELADEVARIIEGWSASLDELKRDLVNAGRIVKEYNKHAEAIDKLKDSTTWATRGVLK